MPYLNCVEISAKLYNQFQHFKSFLTKAEILKELENLPTHKQEIDNHLYKLQLSDQFSEIKAFDFLLGLRKYLADFSDDHCFYKYTVSINPTIDITLNRLSKKKAITKFKNLNSGTYESFSVYITPYNMVEILTIATQVANMQMVKNRLLNH